MKRPVSPLTAAETRGIAWTALGGSLLQVLLLPPYQSWLDKLVAGGGAALAGAAIAIIAIALHRVHSKLPWVVLGAAVAINWGLLNRVEYSSPPEALRGTYLADYEPERIVLAGQSMTIFGDPMRSCRVEKVISYKGGYRFFNGLLGSRRFAVVCTSPVDEEGALLGLRLVPDEAGYMEIEELVGSVCEERDGEGGTEYVDCRRSIHLGWYQK